MSGFIVYWSKEYMKRLEKNHDTGPLCVIYGSHHLQMPSIASVKKGDIIYPVTLQNGILSAMARLPVENIEPAFDYLMREIGTFYSALLPDGVLIKQQTPHGEFNAWNSGGGYTGKTALPGNIHTVLQLENLTPKPHKIHQEPVTCCADLAASGSGGSVIRAHSIPPEDAAGFLFGKNPATQKPLKTDKTGRLTTTSLSGFVRKMSEDTFRYFEQLFV